MEHNPKTKNYHVTTRRGRKEPLDISIIRRRLEDLSFGLNLQYVNLDLIVLRQKARRFILRSQPPVRQP